MNNHHASDGFEQRPASFAAAWVAGPRKNMKVTVTKPAGEWATIPPFIHVEVGGLSINVTNADDADYLAALITNAAAELRAIETKEGNR